MTGRKKLIPLGILLLTAETIVLTACGSSASEAVEPVQEEARLNTVYRDALLTAWDLEEGGVNGLDLYRNPETRERVKDFYTAVAGDPAIAHPILAYADEYSISPSLAFSMAWAESSFRPWAVNYNKNPVSVDRGLFQLNSRSFPDLSQDEYFDPEVSAYHGLKYFAWCREQAGNTVKALALYNAGIGKVRSKGAPESTLDYIHKITAYQEKLEKEFAQSLAASVRGLAVSGKTVKKVQPIVDRKKQFD